MATIETERLHLREMTAADGEFLNALMNEPPYLQYIGDRGIRSPEDAVRFIESSFVPSYRKHGYGLYAVEVAASQQPVGITGLVRRAGLTCPDLGFAFLEETWGRGYAREASEAAMVDARERLRIDRIQAICSPANVRSIGLLLRLGFQSKGLTRLTPEAEELRLFERALQETGNESGAAASIAS